MNERTLSLARRALVRWYRRQRRDLPWRRTHDPYAIWISEIMLQQTRVDVVVPYYERFLRQYPSVTHLANAPIEAVLRLWAGLGYYSRARHLHQAAQQVVSQYDGILPADPQALLALPGIGRYTAGAIMSLAYGRPAPILDGNVARVFARLSALTADVRAAAGQNALWRLATHWARCTAPGDANQAVMELGATLCTPKSPQCAACPLSHHCRAHQRGLTAKLPRLQRPARGAVVRLAAVLLRHESSLLLVRRQSGRLLRDWWEVPTWRLRPRQGASALRLVLRDRSGITVDGLRRSRLRVRHGILSHRLQVDLYVGGVASITSRRALPRTVKPSGTTRRPSRRAAATATPLANLELEAVECRFWRAGEYATLPVTTLTRKVLAAAARVDSAWKEYLHEPVGERGAHERRRHPAEHDV